MGNLVPRAFVLVTWELGLAYFWTGIMKFGLLHGTGNDRPENGNGKSIYQYKDSCIVRHFRV